MLIPLHCILAFHLLLLLHHHLAQHILRFFISLSESIFSLHLVQFECSKAESLIFMPREILLKPSKSHCTCANFFFSSIFTSQFSIKSTTKKNRSSKMQKSFRTRVIVFYKEKKTTILKWNIAGSRDANPHIEVLSAPTSPVEQTPLKSAIGRNPLRGSKCKSKTISFWFFLSFFYSHW